MRERKSDVFAEEGFLIRLPEHRVMKKLPTGYHNGNQLIEQNSSLDQLTFSGVSKKRPYLKKSNNTKK